MDSRSGGKIVTKRYRRHNTTPYDRPAPSEPAPKDPNWLARVIFPATRVIASGASKIISSVFDSDSSSSSSLSLPDSENASENDDINNENNDEADSIHSLNDDHGNCDKSCTAEQVEQLLMQGNFTRQECDRFIEIIKSRALESSLQGEDDEHFGTENSDKLRSKAVMEARKWLDQKKVESAPMPNIADEFGSPADVAKEYLKSRSPWLSPDSEPFEIRTPATMTSPFQEGTSMAAGHEFSSLFKKRSSLASGSWNIQDEIRSVRAKATEDMLKSSSPSTRNPLPFYVLSSPSTDFDTASRIVAERQTVLAIPAKPVLEKHNPKALGENAALSDSSPHSHSNDHHKKDSKVDDESGTVLVGTENVDDALPTSQATTISAEENVNGDKPDETIVNVTVPTEYEGSAFLSEASVEVTVMEETTDSMVKVTVVNSDDKIGGDEVDEMPMKEEEAKKPKPVRSSSRIGGNRGRGRGRGKGGNSLVG